MAKAGIPPLIHRGLTGFYHILIFYHPYDGLPSTRSSGSLLMTFM